MYTTTRTTRTLGFALTSAMAGALLAGCATQAAPRGDLAASKAEAALSKGKVDKAVASAEEAVQAEPRNAAYRAMLGTAYLEAGRFASAATSFDDAMALGDTSTRTALSLALALTGQGKYNEAVAVVQDWDDAIAPADLGLAYALAGQPQRGVQVMSNAFRGGETPPKMRQNLAYAYALSGQWKEARLMAAQDVPAGQLGDRIQEWALMTQPEAWQQRVAALIGAPSGVADGGQPVALALSNTPSVEELATEASAFAAPQSVAVYQPAQQPVAHELPAVGDAPATAVQSHPSPRAERADDFQTAFATIAPAGGSSLQVSQDATRFAQEPVVQATPPRQAAAPRQCGPASAPA